MYLKFNFVWLFGLDLYEFIKFREIFNFEQLYSSFMMEFKINTKTLFKKIYDIALCCARPARSFIPIDASVFYIFYHTRKLIIK